MKQFLSVHDVADLPQLIQEAMDHKAQPLHHKHAGSGKRIGCLFMNPSMRTRLSTQVAAQQLGMECIVFNVGADGWNMEFEDGAIMNGTTVEHVKDAAPILGKYFDVLAVRTFPGLKDRNADYSEHIIQQFVKYAGVPVLSLESATRHPLQSLADLMTISEVLKNNSIKQRKPKVVLTWAPHVKALPQCVANSFAEWMGAWGESEFVIAQPKGYELEASFTQTATIVHNQEQALEGADFVYAKNWSSYEHYGSMPSVPDNWLLNTTKWSLTNKAKLMHCLPVRRNVELPDELLDSSHSLITQQAENRVWAAQSIIHRMLQS